MSKYNSPENHTGKIICCGCVEEDFLRREISNRGQEGTCSYCKNIDQCIPIIELAYRVEKAFEEHYYKTSTEPSPFEYTMIKEGDYEWNREGENVVDAIAWAAGLENDAASDIQEILSNRYYDHDCAAMGEETEFDSESHYMRKGPNAGQWHSEWYDFEKSLKTQTRFFSKSASELLHSIFNGIGTIETTNGKTLIADAGPETELQEVYRARNFQSDKKLKEALAKPDKRLGPPPTEYARAGRMNAQGISVFYGANEPIAALAEIRPPVGCQVVVTRFEIIRPLKLLDLTALDFVDTTTGSIFDPTFIDRIEKTMFLKTLGRRMTVPVMPDNEALDYLTTQAIADFLSSENVPQLDGIIFPSVQTGGHSLNVVLFHKASIVEKIEIADGTEINVTLGYEDSDDWVVDYTVIEKFPPPKKQEKPKYTFPIIHDDWDDIYDHYTTSEPSLKVDMESIRVHKVSSVKFTTSDYPVKRHKWEQQEAPKF